MFNGAHLLETVDVGAFTGFPAQTIWPAEFSVELSAFCTFWNTYEGFT